MFSKFFGSGTERISNKNFLTDNRAQRLLISILDGSFEKQIQTKDTSSKTGYTEQAYLAAATLINSMGYSNKRQTVEAVRDVSADTIKLPVNIVEELGPNHQQLIPDEIRAVFDCNMTILTAILKIEQFGFAKVRGDNQDANNAYTEKLIEIIRVLTVEKGMIPSDEDIAIMRELGSAFNEFIPKEEKQNIQFEPEPVTENHPEADMLETAVNQIISKVQAIAVEKQIVLEPDEQITLPRNYFRLFDKIECALKNKDSKTLSIGLQNLTENFEFKIYAGALISVANDFDPSQSPTIKQKLLDLKQIVEETLEQQQKADDELKPQNIKGMI
jgi:hypothetical protein